MKVNNSPGRHVHVGYPPFTWKMRALTAIVWGGGLVLGLFLIAEAVAWLVR